MDYKFSFIVPCYRGKFEEVKRNFDSILDQDYKNWEIIFVPNGQWTGKKALIKKVSKDYKGVKILSLDEPNVCVARNKGAEIATGDIFSFLSSDLALHSGTLRTWQLEFSKHPECGFVYSGYRFFPDVKTDVFLSEGFDEYKLRCYNYIDGANPVRREVNVPFDPEIPSLNDWDWILSIVKKGHKGFYVPEPLFSAELPKPGGLSWDSNMRWTQRTEQIKKKHGIPIREICCTSLIDPDEALRIAKAINADYHPFPAQKDNPYKVVYIYGFACTDEMIQMQAACLSGKVQHAHKIVHWIGLDVTTLARRPWGEVEALTKAIFKRIKEHWVVGSGDEQILTEIFKGNDIKLKRVYPPIEKLRQGKLQDMVYVSDREVMEQVKLAMPDIDVTNKNGDGIPKISIHFVDRPSNIVRAVAEGSFVITEKLMPYTGRLVLSNIPEIRRQIVHTIRKLNKEGITKDRKAMKFYRDQGYFKQKLQKISEIKIQRLGRLEDVLPTMPSEEQLRDMP